MGQWPNAPVAQCASLSSACSLQLYLGLWRRGDEIVLQRSHVLEASEPWDVLTFSGLLAALGSASEAAMV